MCQLLWIRHFLLQKIWEIGSFDDTEIGKGNGITKNFLLLGDEMAADEGIKLIS